MSSEKPLSDINFFICSTYRDLRTYRDAVLKNIRSHAGVINAQEFFGARDQKPLATCLEELDKSDVFIMFLGPRYGSVDGDTNRSFVECEYERAKARSIPKFAYLIDISHPFPIEHVSLGEDAERLRRFKDLVQSELTVDYFTTPDDLAKKVYDDLVRELPKRGFKLGQEQPKDKDASAALVLRQFLALPKLFHGRTVKMRVQLGSYSRVDRDGCGAFSYRYGAAVARAFKPSSKDLADVIGSRLSEIFAEEQAALALIAAPSDVEIDVTVKTIQGECSVESPIYGYEEEPGLFAGFVTAGAYGRRRVVVNYRTTSRLICGLELVELNTPPANNTRQPTPADGRA